MQKNIGIIFLAVIIATSLTACGRRQISDEPPPSLSTAAPSVEAAPAESPTRYNDYNLTLIVDPENRTVDAIEKVKYINQTGMALDSVYFNVYLNAFSEESLQKPYLEEQEAKIFKDGHDYAEVHINNITVYNESVDFNLQDTSLQVMFEQELQPNETTEIAIAFSAYIPKINHRTGANNDAMWFGNFIPTLAVYDEYGWHSWPYYPVGDPFYTEIANFTATIITPADYCTVSTGIEDSLTTDNRTTTIVTTKLTRDFAFYILRNCNPVRYTTRSGVDISFYTHQDTLIDRDEYYKVAEAALAYFSENVGAYPYAQLDLVEAGLSSDTFKAYPEMIFMDSDYMVEPGALRSLVHHIGHQWFYNIIGNNGVKEAWLAEGLLMYLQDGLLSGSVEALHQSMLADYESLKTRLKTIGNKTLLQDLSVYADGSEYYHVQFTRSKLMIYALQRKLGTVKFAEFLKTYYNHYSFQTVNRNEFIMTAEEVYGDSLADFFDGWMQNYDLPPL